MSQQGSHPGISGFSVYVPPFRVSLEDWCGWNDQPWGKISKVVGRSFRQAGRHESIYTIAANAVLRLIENYEIDASEVGFLAFGTESSTDNAAGAVILRGMVDKALEHQGRPRLSRALEVPEVKHACLGGIYAIKSALRYLATDGRGKRAIVVCGDIAEYERGSSGEQTQGAGAVAVLLENDAKLCTIDLTAAGSSSAYRGVDFRKPFARHAADHYTPNVSRQHDFPVFNGKYSTFCYLDAVAHATRTMFDKLGVDPIAHYEELRGILFHRPYHWMPVQAMATLYVWGLAQGTLGRDELAALCQEAGVAEADVRREIDASQDLFDHVERTSVDTEPHPNVTKLAKLLRSSESFQRLRKTKMDLGADKMMDVGNIYTAALPGWIAAAFEDALERDEDLTGRSFLTVGYGSGDAAEAIPLTLVPNWREAAARIGFSRALEGSVGLTQPQYEALHDGKDVEDLTYEPSGEFVVERVGNEVAASFQDIGIEYYRYAPRSASARQVA